jgi:hypothetical protein
MNKRDSPSVSTTKSAGIFVESSGPFNIPYRNDFHGSLQGTGPFKGSRFEQGFEQQYCLLLSLKAASIPLKDSPDIPFRGVAGLL